MARFIALIFFIACICAGPGNEVVIKEKPLDQVIEVIRAGTGKNIIVKWNQLEVLGVEKDTEISLKVHDVKWKTLINLVLEQAGGDAELAWEIDDDGIIIISTKEDLSRNTKTHVYDVNDLVVRVPTFIGPRIDITQAGGQGQGGQVGGIGGGRFIGNGGGGAAGGGNGGNLFEEGDEEEDPEAEADVLAQLMDLIRATIDPDSWRSAGGNTSSLSPFHTQIVVTQTSDGHRQLRDL